MFLMTLFSLTLTLFFDFNKIFVFNEIQDMDSDPDLHGSAFILKAGSGSAFT
jgi:hypothetical protein